MLEFKLLHKGVTLLPGDVHGVIHTVNTENKMTTTSKNVSEKSTLTERINALPGGEHLIHIRDALLKKNASVMIGAGFSLNAEGGRNLPTWSQLIDGLLDDLHGEDNAAKREVKTRLGGTSGMLRLAEEYAEIRGRSQLDKRLQILLPDAGVVEPGELHKQLLSLSWTDVFTTNYDTLLERTLDKERTEYNTTIKRRYQLVVGPNDIPFSRQDGQPRIIKLHGTLRGGTKLIVTEEDYRRYPREYAPFVNTVQQSMLENVFCLIGFSGDDPNFLSWTGWARDHLGDKAPNLFLITLSPMTPGQRLILQRRRIFPIDISDLGRTEGQKGVDYGKALATVLDFWKETQPLDRLDWPYENPLESYHKNSELEQLSTWLKCAQRNREAHPGWLVTPRANRVRLTDRSSLFLTLRSLKDNKTMVPWWFSLLVLNEIRWIRETSLTRLDKNMEEAFIKALDEFVTDKERSSVPITYISDIPEPSSQELDEIRAGLLLELLRDAREDNNDELFAERLAHLTSLPSDQLTLEQQCFLLHERILFNLEHLEKSIAIDLLEILEQLLHQNVDPYWSVRAGALLGEVGIVRKGYDIAKEGLKRIKLAIQNEGESPYLKSRQLWAEWILNALHYAAFKKSKRRDKSGPATWSPEPGLQVRIEEAESNNNRRVEPTIERTAGARGNIEYPSYLMDEIRTEIDVADNYLENSVIRIDDEGISNRSGRVLTREEGFLSAVQYLRLAERAGLPPHISTVQFTSKTLLSCFRIMAIIDDANTHIRVFKRALLGPGHKLAESLQLPIVQSLNEKNARQLFQKMMEALDLLSTDTKWNEDDAATIEVRLDTASRLAFRLTGEDAIRLCDLAIRLYDSPTLRRDFTLYTAYRVFFSRAFRLLPVEKISEYEPILLSLSRSDDTDRPQARFWPDIVQFARRTRKLPKNGSWSEVVNKALNEFSEVDFENEEQTSQCIRRLDWLFYCGCMSDAQVTRFSKLLWKGTRAPAVPKFKNFRSGAFVSWPHPHSPAKHKEAFIKFLEKEPINPIETMSESDGVLKSQMSNPSEDYVFSLLLASQNESMVQLNETELVRAFKKIQHWWDIEGRSFVERARSDSGMRDMVQSRLLYIAQVVNQVLAPKLTLEIIKKERLDVFFEELWDASVSLNRPLVALLFGGLKWWPEKSDSVLQMAIIAIQSNPSRSVVFHALMASFRWLIAEDSINESSVRFVQFLADGILQGDEYALERKLETLKEISSRKPNLLIPHSDFLLSALGTLIEILGDPKQADSARFNLYATPLLRYSAVKTLCAIGKALPALTIDPRWVNIVQMAKNDPLLMVRNLVQ